MKPIQAKERSIRDLLSGKRYGIDYYQREYKWQDKHVRELLRDLVDRFDDDYSDDHELDAIQDYGSYFLGSVILSQRDKETYIVDGQQRLTTLTLILIHLYRELPDPDDKALLQTLIFSQYLGKRAFNLNVDARILVMNALFRGETIEPNGQDESVNNILARYRDIEDFFSNTLESHTLRFFAHWLLQNVYLVEILAFSDGDAYTIFETMNDRGLSLSPLDMLKGYMLANITNAEQRLDAEKIWRKQVSKLVDMGKDEDSDAFKSWLRSQHAETIRERRKNAQALDFDRIGTEFHRWVREKSPDLGLTKSADFHTFVQRDLHFYTNQQMRLRKAAKTLTPGLESIFYIARMDFTLQFPVLLAPLTPDDDEATIRRKWRVTSAFLDILIARRLWNFRLIAYSTMQYAMFLLIKLIRRKSVDELVTILSRQLDADGNQLANSQLYLHQQNRYSIFQILARLTEHVEQQSGMPSRYLEYIAEGRNRHEVEHIWANHPERHEDEFATPDAFYRQRNYLGGLLLLPKPFNASYGDLRYEEKLPHYFGQNILARSLHPPCYENNPGFLAYVRRSGLPFRPMLEFRKEQIDERQDLYLRIAEEVWSPARLEQEARSV